MTLVFAGFAILLLVIGAFFTFSRQAEAAPEFELPSLNNNYRNTVALTQRLNEWVDGRDAALGAWLRTLNPQKKEALIKEVEKFCKKKQFEVAWVIDQQIEDAELQATLDQFLLQFLNGERLLIDSEKELRAYVALVKLVQNPSKRKHKHKTQMIYLQLVSNEVLPQDNIDMLLSKDSKRWENAARSITLASRTDRPIVNRAVQEHVLGETPRAEPVVVVAPPVAS